MTFQLPWGGGYTSWGYTSASRTIEGLTGVVYMPNEGYCEAARTNGRLQTRGELRREFARQRLHVSVTLRLHSTTPR